MNILKVKDWKKIKNEQFKSVFDDNGEFKFLYAKRHKDGQEFRCGDIVMTANMIDCKVAYVSSDNIHLYLRDLKNIYGSNIYDHTIEINDLIWISGK